VAPGFETGTVGKEPRSGKFVATEVKNEWPWLVGRKKGGRIRNDVVGAMVQKRIIRKNSGGIQPPGFWLLSIRGNGVRMPPVQAGKRVL